MLCNASAIIENFTVHSKTLRRFDDISSPTACCELCSIVAGCAAFTINGSGCDLKDDLLPIAPATDSVAGAAVGPVCPLHPNERGSDLIPSPYHRSTWPWGRS